MATTYWRDGQQITGDFLHGTGEDQVRVPYANLLVWNDATLASYGVTKVTAADVPQVISDRQFFQCLAVRGIITQAEALAAVQTGTLPAAFEGLLATFPGDQFAARMLLTGATEFERNHPLVEAFGTAFGWGRQDIDDFWTEAYAL